MIVAVDPGTRSTGVATPADGDPWVLHGKIETWRADGGKIDPQGRQEIICRRLVEIFDEIDEWYDNEKLVLIEDGIYRTHGRNIAMIGELRGIIMAEVWRRGWTVKKVSVQWWRSFLPAEDRKIKKGRAKAYVGHFNLSRGWYCTCTDEVDAALIVEAAYKSGLYR